MIFKKMGKCVVWCCKNRSDVKVEGLSFHKIPASKDAGAIWARAIARNRNKISQTARICSAHFSSECFETYGAKIKLKGNAVPTLLLKLAKSTSYVRTAAVSNASTNEPSSTSLNVSDCSRQSQNQNENKVSYQQPTSSVFKSRCSNSSQCQIKVVVGSQKLETMEGWSSTNSKGVHGSPNRKTQILKSGHSYRMHMNMIPEIVPN